MADSSFTSDSSLQVDSSRRMGAGREASAGKRRRGAVSHDAGYAALFSHPDMVRDLIQAFVPDAWLQQRDFSSLEKIPHSYVTDDGERKRAGDVVWRLYTGDYHLYLLIEFQSRPDRYMALRMMVYTGLLYQDLLARGLALADHRLPPVLPIALYNGSRPWRAAPDIRDAIPSVPGLAGRFTPQMPYLLIDQNACEAGTLNRPGNLAAALVRLERAKHPAQLASIAAELNQALRRRPALKRLFGRWIRMAFARYPGYDADTSVLDVLQEQEIMLSERVAQWAREYKQEGQADLLIQLLNRRFGPQPDPILKRIRKANTRQLETWSLNILDATDIADVFRS